MFTISVPVVDSDQKKPVSKPVLDLSVPTPGTKKKYCSKFALLSARLTIVFSDNQVPHKVQKITRDVIFFKSLTEL